MSTVRLRLYLIRPALIQVVVMAQALTRDGECPYLTARSDATSAGLFAP